MSECFLLPMLIESGIEIKYSLVVILSLLHFWYHQHYRSFCFFIFRRVVIWLTCWINPITYCLSTTYPRKPQMLCSLCCSASFLDSKRRGVRSVVWALSSTRQIHRQLRHVRLMTDSSWLPLMRWRLLLPKSSPRTHVHGRAPRRILSPADSQLLPSGFNSRAHLTMCAWCVWK